MIVNKEEIFSAFLTKRVENSTSSSKLKTVLARTSTFCKLVCKLTFVWKSICELIVFNRLRPNNDVSHCNIRGLSVSEVMRIENMITQVQLY